MLWLSPLMIVVARMLMRSTLPVVARHRHHVADADGPFQEQDDPANEVGDDFLQPKPEPDAEGRQDHADLGEVQVNGRQRDQARQAQYGIAAKRDDGEPSRRDHRASAERPSRQTRCSYTAMRVLPGESRRLLRSRCPR